jgi:16S rRNA (uracil1498-N3)-methyltransferase
MKHLAKNMIIIGSSFSAVQHQAMAFAWRNNPIGLPRRRARLTGPHQRLSRKYLSIKLSEGSEQADPGTDNNYTRLPRLYVGSLNQQISFYNHDLIPLRSPTTPTLSKQRQIPLSKDQSHYLTSVLRLNKKKKTNTDIRIRIFDGVSGEWLARIIQLDDLDGKSKRRQQQNTPPQLLAECLECLRPQVVPIDSTRISSDTQSPSLWLAPPKKKERLRWLVEKTTELNVQTFLFLETDHSESGFLGVEKLQLYAMEAAEQCERLTIPQFVCIQAEVEPHDYSVERFEHVLHLWEESKSRSNTKILFCRERLINSQSVLTALESISTDGTVEGSSPLPQIVFVVGPEGGWSKREEAVMNDLVNRFPKDAFNISLGANMVLRAETAAMCAVAAYTIFTDMNRVNTQPT